jgi:hypothetical protein
VAVGRHDTETRDGGIDRERPAAPSGHGLTVPGADPRAG